MAACISARAADLSVAIVDRDGHGVDGAVVTATPLAGAAVPAAAHKTTIMDQKNLTFVPRVLVVAVGSNVEFPNSDSVSHQVYSFSPAKHFQLALYKGEVHPPIKFEQPGLVVLGCNIHDSMIGYIYVTDAPYFGTTDAGGSLQLKGLSPGDYRVVIWSPFIADEPASLVRTAHVEHDLHSALRLELHAALHTQPQPTPRRRDWEY